jgi:hypothetical protein
MSPQQSDPPATPMAVGKFLAALTDELGVLVKRLGEADRAAVQAREKYIRARAVAFAQASGSIEAKKNTAIRTTHGYRLEAEEADCEVRDLQRQVDYVKVRIGVGQSLGAAVRAELQALGG